MPPLDPLAGNVRKIQFLFYRIGMGAPSIARTLRLPIGAIEKYCATLPNTEYRRKVQLRTRYAGKLRHYEKKIPRIKPEQIDKIYAEKGSYDDMPRVMRRSMEISQALEPVTNALLSLVDYVISQGTYCADCGNGYVVIGTNTVTKNRLSAIVTSMRMRAKHSIPA